MKSLRTGVPVLMKLTLTEREETKVSKNTQEQMFEDLKKCPSGSLRPDFTKQTLEERFNEQWLNGISKWLVEQGWKKEEDEV